MSAIRPDWSASATNGYTAIALDNTLLARLPPASLRPMLAICERSPLVLSASLHAYGTAAQHVYFPCAGFVSLVSVSDSHPGLEVGMIGREGMVGLHVALGVDKAPLQAIVQGAGWAWRAEAQAFGQQLTRNAALRARLGLYTHVQMTQLARNAACVRFHLISERLARWLLMSADRARSNELPLTQEFLSYMLGVRRAGITQAAGGFRKHGLIRYTRGMLTLTNRAGLVAAACSCYAQDRAGYAAVMG